MKKTTKKLSLGMKIASILACLALVSVGFASWWIVQLPDPVEYNEGSFTVYSVDTKNIKIENLEFANTPAGESSSTIIFGKTSGVTQKWLLAEDIDDQNLTATFSFDVNLYDNYKEDEVNDLGTGAINSYVDEITLDFLPTGIDNAISNGYITAPKITYTYGTNNTGTKTYSSGTTTLSIDMAGATSNTAHVTVTIEFDWGATFGGQNPYEFYNAEGKLPNGDSGVARPSPATGNMTWAEHADTALTGLNALANANSQVTLTAQIAE